ncbi:MAG: aldo/keto reductase [Myxococcota bacterium]
MSNVERIELAPGLEISRLLTGLWQIADMEREGGTVDPEQAARDMERYVDAGLTTFDMADHYGSSEIIAGAFDERRPGASQLLTKWVPKPGPITLDLAREAVERALERMGRARLDLLQFHAWNYADPSYLDGLYHLQTLKREGLIAHLGVTNVDTAHLRLMLESGIEIASNQICYSLIDQRARKGMTELCREHGVRILAFGTLAGGFLTERWVDAPEPTAHALGTWSQMKYKRFIDASGGWERFQNLLRILREISAGLGASMANVATRAILEAPAVGGVIVGARLGQRAHFEDNLKVFDFELDAAARASLDAALAALEPIPGDCGDEYRKPPFLTASGDLSHHLETFPAPFPTCPGPDGRTLVLSGTEWEDLAGFARAVRTGDRVLVSGTTATHGTRRIGGDDPAAQATFCLDKIEGALQSLGARMEDVVRTRIYVSRPDIWEPVARAHGTRFAETRPANTLVSAQLIGDGYLVEMEAEAVVPSSSAAG